eukprot:g1106.t1
MSAFSQSNVTPKKCPFGHSEAGSINTDISEDDKSSDSFNGSSRNGTSGAGKNQTNVTSPSPHLLTPGKKHGVSYGEYLQLSSLLDCQKPLSTNHGTQPAAHEELLFIHIHQSYEIWFKHILHELDSIQNIFKAYTIPESSILLVASRLERITVIQKLLVDQLSILETMTPQDFLSFRDFLFPASGFQSVQFRLIENKLGLLRKKRLKFGGKVYCSYLNNTEAEEVTKAENEPSLFELINAWLTRTPFINFEENAQKDTDAKETNDVPGSSSAFNFLQHYRSAISALHDQQRSMIAERAVALSMSEKECEDALANVAQQEDYFNSIFDETRHAALLEKGKCRLSFRATQAALLITLYQHEPLLNGPYRILFLLQEIDALLARWRTRHALMVHRMIGVKVGTGGSSGYHYLSQTVKHHQIFGDLANLSTYLIARENLPPLPEELRQQMSFYYTTKSQK